MRPVRRRRLIGDQRDEHDELADGGRVRPRQPNGRIGGLRLRAVDAVQIAGASLAGVAIADAVGRGLLDDLHPDVGAHEPRGAGEVAGGGGLLDDFHCRRRRGALVDC